MAKKDKQNKHAVEGETKNEAAPQTNGGTEPKKANPFKDAKPSRFLRDQDGKEFKITPFNLPKKAAVVGTDTIDGASCTFQTTNNKGFTTPETVLNYKWFTFPDGTTGYITLDYNVEPKGDQKYTLHTGVTERKDPARVPKSAVVGDERIAKFKETQAKKAAAKASGAPEAGSTTPGAEGTAQPAA